MGGRHILQRKSDARLAALSDETAGAVLRESVRLPDREKQIVLGVVRRFVARPDAKGSR
jgi:hypothetical protein